MIQFFKSKLEKRQVSGVTGRGIAQHFIERDLCGGFHFEAQAGGAGGQANHLTDFGRCGNSHCRYSFPGTWRIANSDLSPPGAAEPAAPGGAAQVNSFRRAIQC